MAMNVEDYLIDQGDKDWAELISGWRYLLPNTFDLWLVNRFGDLFAVFEDGSVHLLDVGRGTVERLADSREHFIDRMDQDGNGEGWLLTGLVDECVRAGMKLKENQCYGFKIPPILGGDYEIANIEVTDLAVHYSLQAQICRQARELPPGTKVNLSINKDS
jgi:hypothetical protein